MSVRIQRFQSIAGEYVGIAYTLIVGLDDQLRRLFLWLRRFVTGASLQRIHNNRQCVVQDKVIVCERPWKIAHQGKALSWFDLDGAVDWLDPDVK